MTSKFVSNNDGDKMKEDTKDLKVPILGKNEEAWIKVQKEIEAAAAARKAEQSQRTKHNADKSLYEILEANKAAKQEAFEEATRLRNQFRALDEDEVDFLDSILEGTRAQEAKVKAETIQELRLFRRRQAEEDQKVQTEVFDLVTVDQDDSYEGEKSSWTVSASGSRKRKRARESKVGGRVSKNQEATSTTKMEKLDNSSAIISLEKIPNSNAACKILSNDNDLKLPLAVASKNALVNYGSDDED